MQTSRLTKKTGIACLSITLCVAGCATPHGGGTQSAGSASGECNAAMAAGVGALLGALVAKGNNRVKGAAIGAGLGALACVAWNHNARQTKTAEQTQIEYRNANQGQLPEATQLTGYQSRIDPGSHIKPGSTITVTSDIEVVQGTRDIGAVAIEEELVMQRPDGQTIKAKKQANEGSKGATGGYQTSYTLKMPEGIPQGAYPVKTSLYLNGKLAAERNLDMQVVHLESGDQTIRLAMK